MALNALKRICGLRQFPLSLRYYSGASPTEGKIKKVLEGRFPQAKTIEVTDVSGGCGAMFEIMVEAPEMRNLNIVKQHRLVTEALKEEIKDMHGLRIHTSPS